MSGRPTQNDQVLELLRLPDLWPEGITPIEALAYCGCFRLAARIADLRAQGHVITSDLVFVESRNGRKVRVARYRLVAA